MNGTSRLSRLTSPILIIGMAAILAACTPGIGAGGSIQPLPSASEPLVEPSGEPTPPSESPSPSGQPAQTPSGASPTPAATTTVRAYFYLADRAGGEPGLVPVLREVPATKAVGSAALRALLAGPTAKERSSTPAISTAVPQGVQLLGLSIKDRIATVNLSREFESGGGSASIIGRLAQVVYTVTQFPTVDAVRFQLDGEPVTVFGGEGVLLEKPVGRVDYREELPEIFVDRPAWGGALGNPGRVTGLTRVFEATFHIEIVDGAGRALVDKWLMASCGTGCWGTFDVTIPYQVSKGQWGTLRVFDLSAKDGSRENVRSYPVWLTAGG
jgi:spore germination protein GerM